MRTRWIRRWRETTTRRPRDEGSSLLLVLGTMTVLVVFVSVGFTHSMRTSATAQHATSWTQALTAAEAGIDDYLARLNAEENYWRGVDCDNGALEGPTTRTNDCGWDEDTEVGWLPVPGSERAEFHYEVDVSETPVNGSVDLVATGRSGGVTRSVQVRLRRDGFGEFLYYTVYETKDPADYDRPSDYQTICSRYFWATPKRHTSCTDINFVGGDRINGPMHTNDTMLVLDRGGNGPRFSGTVTTSKPDCRSSTPRTCYRTDPPTSTAHPRFDRGIAYRREIELAESNADLLQYVDGSHTDPGCLYTGPTRIQFLPPTGDAVPQMKVWSRWSSTLNPGCGVPSNRLADWPQTVPVPHNNLIMVRDVPAIYPSAYTPTTTYCAAGSIGGFPQEADFYSTQPENNCKYGTVYVQGKLSGRVTISADNNIVVTGDLTYQGGENGTDALGLIAENSVQVYHPIERECTRWQGSGSNRTCRTWASTGDNLRGPDGQYLDDPVIHAAIQTLKHSFEVQKYDVGNELGDLRIFGTIAQRYRGLVGTTGGGSGPTGYLKDYNYDSRLRYAPPPYFLNPTGATWGQKTYGEVRPRHRD